MDVKLSDPYREGSVDEHLDHGVSPVGTGQAAHPPRRGGFPRGAGRSGVLNTGHLGGDLHFCFLSYLHQGADGED